MLAGCISRFSRRVRTLALIVLAIFAVLPKNGFAEDKPLDITWLGGSHGGSVLLEANAEIRGKISDPRFASGLIVVEVTAMSPKTTTRYLVPMESDGQFAVPRSAVGTTGEYRVSASLRNADKMIRSPEQSFVVGDRLVIIAPSEFTLSSDRTCYVAFGEQKEIQVTARAPSPNGKFTVTCRPLAGPARSFETTSSNNTSSFDVGNLKPTLSKSDTAEIEIHWLPANSDARSKPLIANLSLRTDPLVRYTLHEVVRQSRDDTPNLIVRNLLRLDSARQTYVSKAPMFSIEGKVATGHYSELKLSAEPLNSELKKLLQTERQEQSHEIIVPVANGIFNSVASRANRKDYDKWNLSLFPGPNRVVLELRDGTKAVETQEFTIDFEPPSDAYVWAWMIWNSTADMDLYAQLPSGKPVNWKDPQALGSNKLSAEMMSWSVFSGAAEVFVAYDEKDQEAWQFAVKPDEKVTTLRLPIPTTRVLLITWRKSQGYRYDTMSVDFDLGGAWKLLRGFNSPKLLSQ